MDCSQLYISTVSAGCDETAARYGLGLEIAEYCTAANLDAPIPEVVTAAQCHRNGCTHSGGGDSCTVPPAGGETVCVPCAVQ